MDKTISEIDREILIHSAKISNKLTELECKVKNITCYRKQEDIKAKKKYTKEAQQIFNIHYDNQVEYFVELLNKH